MLLLDQLVEARIAEAQQQGVFDDLPGAGQPLELDDDALIPEALRTGYRLLKNAGYLPPELQLRREIASVEQLLLAADTEEEITRLSKRLRYLMLSLNMSRPGDQLSPLTEQYRDKLLAQFEK